MCRSARPLVLVGGGDHARVVAEAVLSRPDLYDLVGFVDPQPCDETVRRLGLARLGGDDALASVPAARAILGVGAVGGPGGRPAIVARLSGMVAAWEAVVHARASVSSTAAVGEGTVVMAGAVVNTGARIGNHCVINTGAVIEHDVVIGDHTLVGPAVAIGGGTRIGARTYVGLGARVRDHVTIGAGCLVAMGAVVVGDVAEGVAVRGVPAR